MTESNNEKIIRKVKGLLAIANDKKDDSEAQSALLMAQQLMVKYKIEKSQIDEFDRENGNEANMGSYVAVEPKKLKWFEKDLAVIISENFRVKMYYSVGYDKTKGIIFYGYEEDCQLAIEVYNLALHALNHYTKEHVELFYIYKGRYEERTAKLTNTIKNSYMKGFMSGLNESFVVQSEEMVQEYGLALLTPVEVEESFEEMTKGFSKARSYKRPSDFDADSFKQGFEDGKQIDSTPKTKLEG